MFSSFRLRVAVSWSVGLLLLAQADTSRAQVPMRGPMPGRPEAVVMDASGTIEALRPGLIQIKSAVGQPFLLRVAGNANVHVTGTAKADVLGRGSFVSFFAEVDKRSSEVQGKVGELTIFTPSPQRPFGAFPGGKPLADAGQDPFGPNPLAPNPVAGPQAPGAGQPAAGARHPRTRSRRTAAKDQDEGPAVERFEIVGRITGIDKTGKVTVYAPNPYINRAVEIELTEDPQIELDLTGLPWLKLAKPGDTVEARGRQVAPNVAQVNELTIALAEPFTTVKPKQADERPPRRATRSSRRGRAEREEAARAEEAVGQKEPVETEEGVEQKQEEEPPDQAPRF